MRALAYGLGLALLTTGCKGGSIPGLPELRSLKPEVAFKDVKIRDITFQGLDTRFVLEVKNPYPVGMKLLSNDWSLALAGNEFLDGSGGRVNIEAGRKSPVRIPVAMDWTDAFAVAGAMKGRDEIPFELHTRMGFSTPVGEVKVPLRHSGSLPALHKPQVRLQGLRVDGLDLVKQTARLELDVGVDTDQGATISFDAIDYGIRFNGTRVADGNTRLSNIDGSGTLTVPINVNLLELGGGIARAIKNKESLDVGLAANIDVGTPFGSVPLQVDKARSLQLK